MSFWKISRTKTPQTGRIHLARHQVHTGKPLSSVLIVILLSSSSESWHPEKFTKMDHPLNLIVSSAQINRFHLKPELLIEDREVLRYSNTFVLKPDFTVDWRQGGTQVYEAWLNELAKHRDYGKCVFSSLKLPWSWNEVTQSITCFCHLQMKLRGCS